MVVLDLTKPNSNTRFNSEDLRNNFTALSRANDLRCRASDPADLNVNVDPGVFSVNSTTATQFAGGFVTIDTVTGGAPNQERVFVIEISPAGTLFVNVSGLWAPLGTATAPIFTIGNIGLCTVLVTFQDVVIPDDQIVDIRPIVNLGSSAIPPSGIAFADLSDIDGLQSAAFQAADFPTGANPFLTPTTAPIPTLLTDVSGLLTDTGDHFDGTGDRHPGEEIDLTDNFNFSNATDLQTFADDVESNIYQRFIFEHNSNGTHGPKVTILQTSADNALSITHNNVGFTGDAVNIINNGTGVALDIEQNSTTDLSAVNITQSEINNMGGPMVNMTLEATFGEVLHVQNTATNHNSNQEVMRVTQAGSGGAVLIRRTKTNNSTNPGALLNISDAQNMSGAVMGGVRGVNITVLGTGGLSDAVRITHFGGGTTLHVIGALGSGVGVEIEQAAASNALFVNKTNTDSGNAIDITNDGTGFDVRGNAGKWQVNSIGNSAFADVAVGGGTGVATGFLVMTEGAILTVDSTGRIFPTHSFHQVQSFGGVSDFLDNIDTATAPNNTVLILKPVSGHTITLRDNIGGGGTLRLTGNFGMSSTNDRIMLQKDGTDWVEVSQADNS